MTKRQKKRRGKPRKVKVRKKVALTRKDSVLEDSFPNAPTRLPPDVGANFKVKIKKK